MIECTIGMVFYTGGMETLLTQTLSRKLMPTKWLQFSTSLITGEISINSGKHFPTVQHYA
jgi:hypothetical protein